MSLNHIPSYNGHVEGGDFRDKGKVVDFSATLDVDKSSNDKAN